MIAQAVLWGIPTPAFSTALAFFDGYRSEVVPANILQAQRDYFGAHTFRVLPGKENEKLKAGEDIRKFTSPFPLFPLQSTPISFLGLDSTDGFSTPAFPRLCISVLTLAIHRHQLDRSWR